MEDSKGSKKGWSPFKGKMSGTMSSRSGKWGGSMPTHKPVGKAFPLLDPDRKAMGPK